MHRVQNCKNSVYIAVVTAACVKRSKLELIAAGVAEPMHGLSVGQQTDVRRVCLARSQHPRKTTVAASCGKKSSLVALAAEQWGAIQALLCKRHD